MHSTRNLNADGSQAYQLLVVPEITEVSSNSGWNQGQTLTIKGRGFGFDTDTVDVTAGGLTCAVKSVKNDEIKCDVAAGTTNAGFDYTLQSGWRYTRYDLDGASGVGNST